MTRPVLYWISGSPPAWRVMLALTLKGVAYASRRLDPARGDNRTAEYLALNPTGQVPTLVLGKTALRESIAILAFLDRAFPDLPMFGATPEHAARIWQAVMVFESRLAPPAGTVARALFKGRTPETVPDFDAARDALKAELAETDRLTAQAPFLVGEDPSAADLWLYPLLGWLDRAAALATGPVPDAVAGWRAAHPHLGSWSRRFGALPGISETDPPHWRPSPI